VKDLLTPRRPASKPPISAPAAPVLRPSIDLRAKAMNLLKCFAEVPAPLDFVWRGFLLNTIGALCAAGSTGKSFYALQAAMCVASKLANEQLLDLDIEKHGRVVLLNAEDNELLMHHRIHDIGRFLSPSARAEVIANIHVVSVVGMGVDINDARWVDAIIEVAKGARLIVLDTHSRWCGAAPENDNTAQTGVIKLYEYLAAQTGASLLFLHHVGKSSLADDKVDEASASRGASAITDAARYHCWMRGMGKADATKLGIEEHDRRFFVGFGEGKVNAGMKSPVARFYRRHEGGVLLPIVSRDEIAAMADAVAPLTAADRRALKTRKPPANAPAARTPAPQEASLEVADTGIPPELLAELEADSAFGHLAR
jgi:hypothetical protein